MKKWVTITGFIGLIVALYGAISAIFYSNVTWWGYFVLGGTFFLGYVNYKLKNESIFSKLIKNKNKVFKTYFLYLFAGIAIELVGQYLLNFWHYPSFNLIEEIIHSYLIGYPFLFFFINEFFSLIMKKIKSLSLAIVILTLIHVLIIEVTNTFAWEWIYTIPFVTFEILRVNIVVIVGWVILIVTPLIVDKVLSK